ncbi:MAG: hypothetical protein WCJ19_02180 [bacterium]
MYPIEQSESVIIPILAIFILKEKDKLKQKILAVIIAGFGIFLLSIK